MGVPGLWKLANGAVEIFELIDLAAKRFNSHPPERPFRLAIDASIWIASSSQAVKSFTGKDRASYSATMALLCSKLAFLCRIGIKAVVVFDGPHRPSHKRGVDIDVSPSRYESEFKQLIDAYAHLHHTAPGEAEAEMALMAKLGHVDAVMTDDSDAIVLQTPLIFRTWGNTLVAGETTITAYNDDGSPVKKSKLRLSRSKVAGYRLENIIDTIGASDADELLLYPLAVSNDYDSTGIQGVGSSIVHEYLQGHSLGSTLRQAYSRHAESGWMQEFRSGVSEQLEMAASDYGTRALADAVRAVVEDPDVMGESTTKLVLDPITSATPQYHHYAFQSPRQWDVSIDPKPILSFLMKICGNQKDAVMHRCQSLLFPCLIVNDITTSAAFESSSRSNGCITGSYRRNLVRYVTRSLHRTCSPDTLSTNTEWRSQHLATLVDGWLADLQTAGSEGSNVEETLGLLEAEEVVGIAAEDTRKHTEGEAVLDKPLKNLLQIWLPDNLIRQGLSHDVQNHGRDQLTKARSVRSSDGKKNAKLGRAAPYESPTRGVRYKAEILERMTPEQRVRAVSMLEKGRRA